MKIIWICNKKLDIISSILKEEKNCFGGWLDSTSNLLLQNKKINLCVLFPEDKEIKGQNKNLIFYSFKKKDCYNKFKKIFTEFQPNIIHIWGTEFIHTKIAMDVVNDLKLSEKCFISIQGLVSICGKYHYTEGIPFKTIYSFTLKEIIKRNNIFFSKKEFIKRGTSEIKAIQQAENVIGRTDWDRAITNQINSKINYHFCNESLRDGFYLKQWELKNVEKYSIFVSQCNYPIKGFHFLLEAMPYIIKKYPNAHIYTTGKNILESSMCNKLLLSSYQRYLVKLIRKNKLENNITFLGQLSEADMIEQYLKAHVFVSPSTIENSSNSIGEAMLLGCPVVSSDVGGVKNLLMHEKEGYIYQTSAPYMLAYYIDQIFKDNIKSCELSKNARQHALKTHDRQKNLKQLLNIYNFSD